MDGGAGDPLDAPVLGDDDRHHLVRVLRLRAGELVTVADGAGRWRPCRMGPDGDLVPDGPVAAVARPEPEVTIAFALTKGDKPEWVVQKLTEVGVDRIVPVVAAHSVVRWDEAKAARNVARFRAIAREAAMQSRRAWLPVVEPVASVEAVAARAGACRADAGGGPLTLDRPLVLVGPEGGWSETEVALDLPAVDLGPTTLRAETAALAAGIRLCALRGR